LAREQANAWDQEQGRRLKAAHQQDQQRVGEDVALVQSDALYRCLDKLLAHTRASCSAS
jgi:hypothetical protein